VTQQGSLWVSRGPPSACTPLFCVVDAWCLPAGPLQWQPRGSAGRSRSRQRGERRAVRQQGTCRRSLDTQCFAQRAWCLFVHSYAPLGASLLHLGSSRGCRQRGGAADGGFAVLVCWGLKQAGCSNPTSRGEACLCTAAAVFLRLCVGVCRVLISSLHGWACEFLWLVLSAGMCEFRAGAATLHQRQLC
jgi:hypothetical protein